MGSLADETRKLLRRYRLSARKGLGQHFLVAEGIIPRLLEAACLSADDTVIEVGPGLGFLTRELAQKAGRVHAVELDARLAELLEAELTGFTNVSVLNADILEVDVKKLTGVRPYKVVANLPYYITSPILRYFLENEARPELMVVMVQKEVAEVIAAPPGRRSLLTAGVLFYGRPEIVTTVPASAFHPAPEVDSVVLKITAHPEPLLPTASAGSFFTLVRAGFSANRKQIANSLAKGLGLPKADVTALLGKAGINPSRRAETLEMEEWRALWRAWSDTHA